MTFAFLSDLDLDAFDLFIQGNDNANLLTGTAGDDVIDGLGGDDLARGRKGDDTLSGGEGNDTLRGSRGEDAMFGDGGDDEMIGGRGDDTMLGGSGADDIRGGRGDDELRGGAGADTLKGGGGEDVFAYATGEGGDTIADFRIRQDAFGLDAESFGVEGDLEFQNVARTDNDDVNAGLVDLDTDSNVYVLQGIWNNAGQAATAVVDGGEEDDFFFVYYNVNLDVSRLFHFDQEAANAGGAFNAGAGIQQLANLGETGRFAEGVNDDGAIRSLARFEEDNFTFEFDALAV